MLPSSHEFVYAKLLFQKEGSREKLGALLLAKEPCTLDTSIDYFSTRNTLYHVQYYGRRVVDNYDTVSRTVVKRHLLCLYGSIFHSVLDVLLKFLQTVIH